MHPTQQIQKGLAQARGAIEGVTSIGLSDPLVDPGHEVTSAHIAQEQVQGVGGLVETAFAERVSRQGAGREMLWARTGAAALAVVAARKRFEAHELGTGGVAREGGV